jgi:hypothetical protein
MEMRLVAAASACACADSMPSVTKRNVVPPAISMWSSRRLNLRRGPWPPDAADSELRAQGGDIIQRACDARKCDVEHSGKKADRWL